MGRDHRRDRDLAHGVAARIGAGVAMAVGWAAFAAIDDKRSVRLNMLAVTVATLAGLTAVLLAPSGLAEVPVFLAASRISVPIDSG